jgi:TonB family protein
MYFNFEDNHPDTPRLASSFTLLERVLLTVVLYLLVVIGALVAPKLEFVKAWEAERQEALRQQLEEQQKQQENTRFVFVQPKVDIRATKPPDLAELSDIDRRARSPQRTPDANNPMPFARGNSPERVEEAPAAKPTPEPPQPDNPASGAQPSKEAIPLPDSPTGVEPRTSPQDQPKGPALGVLSEAIKNVQKYAQQGGFGNLKSSVQENDPYISFDTKGVEFGPWLRRFIAQIKRNWFIPDAAMSFHGHVVLTFFVHKDGHISDLKILRVSDVTAFNNSAFNALAASNPTQPLPPEYPDTKAFFTVTFFFNESPDR